MAEGPWSHAACARTLLWAPQLCQRFLLQGPWWDVRPADPSSLRAMLGGGPVREHSAGTLGTPIVERGP